MGTWNCWHLAGQAAFSCEELCCGGVYGEEKESAFWLSHLLSLHFSFLGFTVLPGAFLCGAAFVLKKLMVVSMLYPLP